MPTDRVTRFAADLVASAAVEGPRQSRSAKQQLDHWARVGRSVSAHYTSSRRRVEATLEGKLPLASLTDDERLVSNAEIDAGIAERLQSVDFATVLAGEGITTVAMDEQGRLVRYEPDGAFTVIP